MSKSKAKILSLPITNHANYNAETERQENVIGARIDEARRKAGLSLVDFSALLRQYGVTMSPSGINKWAKGPAQRLSDDGRLPCARSGCGCFLFLQ